MAKFIIKRNASNQYWFTLRASGNNEIVCTSEMYASKQGAQNGIEVIKREAVSATVEDQTAASSLR
jgi:uncharacterized protein YegP (UPF0339 family)